MELNGRVALVTGASRGIGRQVALALARQGAAVALNYHRSEPQAAEAAREIQRLGARCVGVRGDVSSSGAVREMMHTIHTALGLVQILVNNAGEIRPQALQDISEPDWDDMLRINLTSAFLVTQAVLPDMRAGRWGRIVNLSSVAAQLGGVVGPHYAASKAGLLGLTHSYASLLSKEGITGNAVAPALIATDMVLQNPNARAELIPVGRFGTVEEVAEVVLMLVGNGYLTGQTINVNGGWYMS